MIKGWDLFLESSGERRLDKISGIKDLFIDLSDANNNVEVEIDSKYRHLSGSEFSLECRIGIHIDHSTKCNTLSDLSDYVNSIKSTAKLLEEIENLCFRAKESSLANGIGLHVEIGEYEGLDGTQCRLTIDTGIRENFLSLRNFKMWIIDIVDEKTNGSKTKMPSRSDISRICRDLKFMDGKSEVNHNLSVYSCSSSGHPRRVEGNIPSMAVMPMSQSIFDGYVLLANAEWYYYVSKISDGVVYLNRYAKTEDFQVN